MSEPAPQPRKWRKRLIWALAILVVARIAIAITVPVTIRKVAAKHDLDCTWQSLSLSLLGGSVELKGLELRPKAPRDTQPPPAPIARIESVEADVAMLDLLRLHPHVVVAAIDGVELHVARAETGAWNFERHLPRAEPAATEAPAPEASEPAAYDLALPVEIDALRAHDVVVFVDDRGVTPAVKARCELNANAWHLGADDRPGRFDAVVTCPGVLDAATVVGELTTAETKAGARLEARLAGLQPRTLGGWLAAFGVTPRADRLSCAMVAELSAETIGPERRALKAGLELRDVRALVDEREHAALDRLRVDVASLTPARIDVPAVELTGGRLRAERLANGHVLAFGFEIGDAPATAPAAPAPAQSTAGAPFGWSVEKLVLRELALAFVDRSVEPAASVELVHGTLEIAHAGFDPSRPAQPMTIAATVEAGGIARTLGARGTVDVFQPKKSVQLELDAQHVTLASVAGYLRAAGLEPTLASGTLRARIDARAETASGGRTTGELHVRDIAFTDASELFALKGIDVTGVDFDPAQNLVRCAAIEIHGTHVPARRDANGAFAAFGVRTLPAQPAPAAVDARPSAAPEPTAPADPTPAAPMRIEIARFAVKENRFDWSDDRVQPPVRAVFDDCGLTITNFGFGGDPARYASGGAKVELYSNAADLVTKLNVTGTITTKPGPLDLALELAGSASGITIERLQPYIDPTGIHENFVGASVSGRCSAHVRNESAGLLISATADDLVFENDGQSIMGLKSLRVDEARIEGDRIRVKSVALQAPRFLARRDPVGALLAAGLRIPMSVFEKGATAAEPSAPAAAPEVPATTSRAEDILAGLPDVAVGEFKIDGGVLAWRDESRTPAVGAEARLDVLVRSFATRGGTTPANFDVRIAMPGSAEAIDVEGTAILDVRAAEIAARVNATGLQAGSLATYLPQGIGCELENGTLAFDAAIQIGGHQDGGLSMDARVGPFAYQESGAEQPFAAFQEVRCSAKRIDPAALVFDIDTLATSGLDLAARRTADGALHAFGFVLAPATAATQAAEPPPDPVTQPAQPANAVPAPAVATTSAAPAPRDDGRPVVRVANLALDLGRVRFRDETQGPGAAPLELRAKVSSSTPIDVFQKPTTIDLEASALPLAETIRASLKVDVAKDAPSFDAVFEVDGIRGAALTELMPSLVEQIDGSQLTHGRLTTALHGVLTWKRRGVLDFDLKNGCAAEIRMDPLRFGEVRDGVVTPLAGVEGIEIDVKRFDPAKGLLHIASLDVVKPSGRFSREPDGLHAFGFVVKPPPEPPPDTGSAPSADAPDRGRAVVAAAPRPAEPKGEVRIDSLTVRGLDVELRDTSTNPPTLVPLDDLDVEITKFTTRAFTEPRALRFNAYLGAGAVDLRDHTRVAPSAEARKVFDEVALSGRVAFYPALEGYAKFDLGRLELPSVAGVASASGITVGEGTLDTSARLRFKGERGATVDSTIVFTDLSLTEQKGGPIESALHLTVPLDTALFLLENDAGEHRIPIHFDVAPDGIGEGAIATAAVGAISSVLVSALASAPLRVVGTFTDLLGLTGGDEKPTPPALVRYAGASTVAQDAARDLAPILQGLRDDSDLVVVLQHRLGRSDIERAAVLANPSAEDCTAHAARLRQRKAELLRERTELVAQARSEFGVGRDAEAEKRSSAIREVDVEIAHVEALLDKTCELLRPGAERARDKRTKAAALAIARERLAALKAYLDATGIRNIDERVEMRSATFDVAEDDSPGTIVVALKKRG